MLNKQIKFFKKIATLKKVLLKIRWDNLKILIRTSKNSGEQWKTFFRRF